MFYDNSAFRVENMHRPADNESAALLPCASEQVLQSTLCHWPSMPRSGFPVAFFGVEDREEWVDEGASFYNVAESK